MTLALQVAGKTDVGCVRANNEDNLGYDARYGIFVVCDGMGGQAAGEVASKLAVDTILSYFQQSDHDVHNPTVGKTFEGVAERGNALGSAIQLANQAIHQASSNHPAQAGMGSTVVAVLVGKNFFSIGHVGDSRVYLLRNGSIQQLTQDHSLVMEQVRRGLITMEEARTSERQNIIIRALGSEETVEPDIDEMMAMPGDVLLLASDGLTRHVSEDRILEIVGTAHSLDRACEELIQAAKNEGGDDNITCMLLRIVEQPWYKNLFARFFPGRGSQKRQNSI